jgi:hypothetical protein
MPIKGFLYHGHAVAAHGQITRPVSHIIDGHAQCALPDRKAGHHNAQHGGFAIAGILSYGACRSEIKAMEEDSNGFFRTEVRSTVENLRVVGEFPLSADRISMGLVSVYRRHWFNRETPHAGHARVLPIDCSLGNLSVNGRAANERLPAPFHFSAAQREAYLHDDDTDPATEAAIETAMAGSASRFVHIPNFGRIYFGEWTKAGTAASQHVHRLTMLRLAMGSPVGGQMRFVLGEGNGVPDPPSSH